MPEPQFQKRMKRNRLDFTVNHRIVTVAGMLKRQIFRIITAGGVEITPEQWNILSYLWIENDLSVGELVSRSKKDFANVTRIVDKLAARGYVVKRRNDKDARSVHIRATELGLSIREQVEKCWDQSLAISLNGVSPEEQQAMLDILKKIETNVIRFLGE